MDFRGDPSSALLEVLDPEQNSTFNDHYLEVDFDLSRGDVRRTANSLNIPGAAARPHGSDPHPGLHRRREDQHRRALPAAQADQGERSEDDELKIDDDAILDIVRYYTREAGVRNLEREIAKICRKVVKEIALVGPSRRKGKREGRQA